ncbi:MAG: hypothetical protein IPP13_22045 [Kouleothrix sp.]|nr:hypothetical protein [Kouleothrix sp.]
MNFASIEWGQIVLALLSVMGGAGGVTAWYRARSQNRTDERKLLTDEQIAFRSAMAAEIGRLSALQQALATDKDKLEAQLADQGRQLERLRTLDEIKERQIAELQKQNADLVLRSNAQQGEIEALREEKARVLQQLTVAHATKELLERENNDLRREMSRLRSDLDTLRGAVVTSGES